MKLFFDLLSNIFFLFAILCLSQPAQASPYVINDNYIGGGATHPSWEGQDVIGAPQNFDISHMEVELTGSMLTVSIFSTYFKNVGYLNTVLGDLFISTDGWSPHGDAPYMNDTALNGEDWELALTLDNHGGILGGVTQVNDFRGQGGAASLYQIDEGKILNTSVLDNIYRGNQVSQYDGSGSSALATGSWFIEGLDNTDYAKLTFQIDFSGLNLFATDSIGFHWNMSCGNDTIQGAYLLPENQTAFSTPGTDDNTHDGSIPEPASLILLIAGLLGASRNKHRRINN